MFTKQTQGAECVTVCFDKCGSVAAYTTGDLSPLLQPKIILDTVSCSSIFVACPHLMRIALQMKFSKGRLIFVTYNGYNTNENDMTDS